MRLNIKNETGRLKSVVLGQPNSLGAVPTLEESYDAKSYYSIEHNIYPKEEDIINGISIALAFLGVAVFLYLSPVYLGNSIVSLVCSIILGVVGIAGLGIELNKLSSKPKGLGFDNLGIGLIFIIIWSLLYYYFNITWVNIFGLLFLIFGTYGTFRGVISVFYNLLTDNNDSKKIKWVVKLPVFIAQLAGFVLTILQILEVIKIV